MNRRKHKIIRTNQHQEINNTLLANQTVVPGFNTIQNVAGLDDSNDRYGLDSDKKEEEQVDIEIKINS